MLCVILLLWYACMVPLNYNFIFTHVYTRDATIKLQCIPITCLHVPRFLVTWNVHVSCNLLCVTCEIATQGTHLGKYLTMPYHKNTTKQFFS